MIKTLMAVMLAAGAIAAAVPAHADPICDAPGLPPCAAPSPMSPEQWCAYIAWRTWTPCNQWGVKVPQGTPGSLG